MSNKRVLIVGGVAGGASCAARLRRMDENAEIFIFERSGDVSFANCGLPYYVGGVIADRQQPAGGHARAVPRFLQHRDSHAARGPPHRPAEPDHRGAKPPDRRRQPSSGTTPWCWPPAPRRCGRRCRASTCPASSPCATWTTSTRSMQWIDHRQVESRGGGRRRLHRPGDGREPEPARHHRHAAGTCRSGHAAGRPRDGRARFTGTAAAGGRSAAGQRGGRVRAGAATTRSRWWPNTTSGSRPTW